MSYSLEFLIDPVPGTYEEARRIIDSRADAYYEDRGEVNPKFKQLHDELTAEYPCLCDENADPEESPWADGPLINNFGSNLGVIGIVFSRVEDAVPFVIQTATKLGITVVDAQDQRIYSPLSHSVKGRSMFSKFKAIFSSPKENGPTSKTDSSRGVKRDQLPSALAALITNECKLGTPPTISVTDMKDEKLLVEIKVKGADFGAIARSTPKFDKQLKALASASTGKTKVIYEVVEE